MAQVLVVDDDPIFREVAHEVLTQAGHRVNMVEDGALAVDAAVRDTPDLVVCDMLMPERDGIETIRDLKRRWPTMKVIAVSAGSRGLDVNLLLRTAKAMGADATMEKPLQAATLLSMVDLLIG